MNPGKDDLCVYSLASSHDPFNLTSTTAETPLWTLWTASGNSRCKSSTEEATPLQALPPDAALAIPEKSGVGENEMFSPSFESFDPYPSGWTKFSELRGAFQPSFLLVVPLYEGSVKIITFVAEHDGEGG